MKLLQLALFVLLAVSCSAYSSSCRVQNVNTDCPKACIQHLEDKNGCLTCRCHPNPKFWGDMRLTTETVEWINQRLENGKETKAATTVFDRWDNMPSGDLKYIPYLMDSTLNAPAVVAIRAAIADYEANTCIRFKLRTAEADYMNFIGNKEGCWAYIGRQSGENQISVPTGCDTKGIAIHEIMHSLGFFHEHQRPDRDQHVQVIFANVDPAQQSQFNKIAEAETDSFGSPYDIGSVMQYEQTAFAKSEGLITMTMANGTPLTGYDRTKLSQTDIDQIKIMYKCPGAPPTSTPPTGTPNSECKDNLSVCSAIKHKCTRKRYVNYMLQNCASTCQFCDAAGTLCFDALGFVCEKLSPFCSRTSVKAKCNKTCGAC